MVAVGGDEEDVQVRVKRGNVDPHRQCQRQD